MIDWKFKPEADSQGSSAGFWYDINEGYIKPEEVLEDKFQLNALNDALKVMQSFEEALHKNDLLDEF